MRPSAILLCTALSLVACKKKEAAPAAAPAPAEPEMTVQMPHEAEAKKMAEKLVANGIQNANPTGSTDFSMDYSFKPDGNWSSKGHAELGGETLDCQETGTWKIEEMVEEKARVEWTIVRTNCPNREAGSERGLVGYEGKIATVTYR